MLRLLLFYLPMGASALLASLTHIIINAVLARSSQPDLTISGYALALSLSFILEQAIAPLRQTSAKFVRDRHSFREMGRMIVTIVGIIAFFNVLIAWTPLGRFLFQYIFGAHDSLLDATVNAYQILMFVNLFSAVRSLYQGIIIQHLMTKWMTIGILIRLIVMALMSWAMVTWNLTNDSRSGAWLFLVGMAIESAVAYLEGHSLAKLLPDKLPAHPINRWKPDLLPFYMPLLYGSIVSIVIGPATNAAMNQSVDPIQAIAAFAIASNIAGLIAGFASFLHQAVLNFHERQPRHVLALTAALSLISAVIVAFFAWMPLGHTLLEKGLGIHGELLQTITVILGVLIIRSSVFPWIDYLNGLAMYHGVNKTIAYSKFFNAILTVAMLFILLKYNPGLNGLIAAITGSVVVVFELCISAYLFRNAVKKKFNTAESEFHASGI